MKWAVLIMLAALVRPLSSYLRSNPDRRLRVFAVAAFLPFVLSTMHLYMAAVNWAWVGYVKGGEISLLDFIALSIYLSLPRPESRQPFRRTMAIYLAVTALSAIWAIFPVAALFYTLQLARVFFVCVTVYRGVCGDRRVPEAVLKGLAAGLFLEVAFAGWQRAHGVLQTPGTFDSQNLLGMTSHFVIFPFFAAILGGRRDRLAPAVVVAGLVIAVLTASRGTILLDCLGLATVFVLSARRQWTPRKTKVLWAGVAAMAVDWDFPKRTASGLGTRRPQLRCWRTIQWGLARTISPWSPMSAATLRVWVKCGEWGEPATSTMFTGWSLRKLGTLDLLRLWLFFSRR
jgi:hypothetical protein